MAHFEGAALPISDYITDTKMVLDQVTRVLKAMVDIAAEEGLFDIVLRLMVLSQLLVQVKKLLFCVSFFISAENFSVQTISKLL